MKIFKTIRFRLTFWYSSLLILLSLVFVVSINVIITNHYHRDLKKAPVPPRVMRFLDRGWESLEEEKKELVQGYRENDLRTIRQISALSFIPLTLFSFLGGYIISGQMLRPLQKVNKATSETTAKNLKRKIKHADTGDEISELINNFNSMISRLNRSFKSQREFIENASHELKTPLAIIQTNLESALVDEKITKKELVELVETAHKSTSFLNKLIEDLLLLSLLEEQVTMKKVDLKKLCESSVKQLKSIAEKKDITIELRAEERKSRYLVKANQILLERAIINIIENAIKYSPKGEKVEISLSKNKSSLILKIKDQGVGIAKKDQKKIFERFYRVDKSRSRKTGGNGLGLAIAKKIMEIHKGEIKILSRVGKGSVFIVSIPLDNS